LDKTTDPGEIEILANEALETGVIGKCTVQFAVIAERNAKYLLNQPVVSLFSVVNVSKKRVADRILKDLEIKMIDNLKITPSLKQ